MDDYAVRMWSGLAGMWNLQPGEEREWVLNVPVRVLQKLEGIAFEPVRGDGAVIVSV